MRKQNDSKEENEIRGTHRYRAALAILCLSLLFPQKGSICPEFLKHLIQEYSSWTVIYASLE